MFNVKNAFILKQSSGFMRSFLYINKAGIVERIFRKNQWSKYNITVKNAQENFSIVLFPDDEIGIMFQDQHGNIYLTMYNDEDSTTHQVYKNTDDNEIYFEAFADTDKIHVVYTMLNRRTESKTIFYQKIDREFNVSPIDIIGNTNFDYDLPFAVYRSQKGNLYITYQRYKDNHCLGYKVLKPEDGIWSKFQEIDISSEPFVDFSMVEAEDKVNAVYIKKGQRASRLINFQGTASGSNYSKIDEDENITSCSLFNANDQLWCIWLKDNKLYGSFSMIDDNNFSSPPYEEGIRLTNIARGMYLTNFSEGYQQEQSKELYVSNNDGPEYLTLPEVYRFGSKVKNNDLPFEGYISSQTLNKLRESLRELQEKNRVIFELKEELERLKSNK